MTETRLEEMKRYLRFDEEDAHALLAFRDLASPHFPRIALEFYERIREHEDAHAVLTGEAQTERLKRSLVLWMGRMLSGTYDEAYAEETRKIGRVHVRVGLPQRYMFTAMALLRVALEAVAESTQGHAATRTRSALTRVLDLELAIMLDSYREHLEANAVRRDKLASSTLRADLADALRLYETALDIIPNLIVGLDNQGLIRLFNREAQTVTGYAVEEVVGASFAGMLSPEDLRPPQEALLAELLRGDQGTAAEDSVVQTRAGKLRDVLWTFNRIDSDTPDGIVLLAIGADVTDVRSASQRALRQENLAAIGTLAAGLAHEIRNPLNAAQLHLSFVRRSLEKEPTAPETLEAVAVVADEIKRLARLVTEFLDFARPSALVKMPVIVQALISRALELTSQPAQSAGIAITADVPPMDLIVMGDVARLEQVLLNIVQNAIEALTPNGSGTIIIRARRQPRAIIIEVEDDGPGLPSPDAPVFDAFFSTKPAGTGLGLSITHRIVTDHGGTIDVESRPGRTCFRLMIPIGEHE